MSKCPFNIFSKFQKKKREIKFYCSLPHGEKLFPIREAEKASERKWLTLVKDLLKHKIKTAHPAENISNVSRCPGVRSVMDTGFIISLHRDVIIETNGVDEEIKLWDNEVLPDLKGIGHVTAFPPQILGNHMGKGLPYGAQKAVIKIGLPWRVEGPLDTVFYVTSVPYSDDSRFQCVPGILDPLIGGGEINALFWWFVKNGTELIKAGTPMVQIIPIKREKIYDSWSMISGDDQEKRDICKFSILNSRLTNYSLVKELTRKLYYDNQK